MEPAGGLPRRPPHSARRGTHDARTGPAAHQTLESEGAKGLERSSKGKRPVSSWCAMTPAAHTSLAGSTSERSVSGAMNLRHSGVEAAVAWAGM